jgi:hypothetical protein
MLYNYYIYKMINEELIQTSGYRGLKLEEELTPHFA